MFLSYKQANTVGRAHERYWQWTFCRCVHINMSFSCCSTNIIKVDLHFLQNIFANANLLHMNMFLRGRIGSTTQKENSYSISSKNVFTKFTVMYSFSKTKQTKCNIPVGEWCTYFDGHTWALFNVSCLIWSPQGDFVGLLCFFFHCALLVRGWVSGEDLYDCIGGSCNTYKTVRGAGSCCWRWTWS